MNILIKNGKLVTPETVEEGEILIEEGIIKEVGESFPDVEEGKGLRILDARGAYVFPGLIDAHTHYHLVSRGTITADSFFEGSRLAAFGGVTTVIDFSDHLPGKRIAEGARERNRQASQGMALDWALHQVVTAVGPVEPADLAELKKYGVTAVKIFTTYKSAGYFIDRPAVKALMKACRDLELMVTIHAEDDEIIERNSMQVEGKPYPPSLLPVVRSAEAEYAAIRDYGGIAGALDMPLYIVHLSSSRGLDAVRELKAEGVRIHCETTPHYLTLTNELLESEGAQKYLMTPPLREGKDNLALWDGIKSGDISIVATDHCTFTEEQKFSSDDCRTIYPGVPGTEEMLRILYTDGVEKGLFDIRKLVSLLSEEPAKAFGLYPRKGSLLPGTDADITIFDPGNTEILSSEVIHSASGYTAYEGKAVKGRVKTVLLGGKIILDEGIYSGIRGGGRFLEASVPGVYRD